MAGGVWTPTDSLISTVTEFQSFTSTITYYELVTSVDGVTGLETQTQVYYPVYITQVSPQSTVTIVNGSYDGENVTAAAISGLYRYIFYDTVIYRDFNGNVKTITGTETQGTWEQIDMNDCYQVIEFIPDSTRYRRFEFNADAKDHEGVIVSSMTYYVDVSDRNWTPGMNVLRNTVQTIRNRGD